jgi:hypothetical protein
LVCPDEIYLCVVGSFREMKRRKGQSAALVGACPWL